MKMIKYPSTEQFRTVIKQVTEKARFNGYDEEAKEVIWDKDAKLPTLEFHGTVKLHGTQGAVVADSYGNVHYQSRKNIVTPEKDNAGFAFFCSQRQEAFDEYFQKIRLEFDNLTKNSSISIYGEFCGGNIQKGVAINGLPKMFVIFGIKVSPDDEEKAAFWIDHKDVIVSNPEKDIYNIEDFQTWDIEIDFDDKVKLAEAQNEMLRLTTLVGDECPVGKAFGKSGIGEGIVWCHLENGERLVFKTKDERHSKSKVKVPKVVDVELEKTKKEFVEKYACTESRLNQMWTEIVHSVHNGNEDLMEMKDMGQYLRLIHQDVIKENSEEMSQMGLEPKSVNGTISKVAREFFVAKLQEI